LRGGARKGREKSGRRNSKKKGRRAATSEADWGGGNGEQETD